VATVKIQILTELVVTTRISCDVDRLEVQNIKVVQFDTGPVLEFQFVDRDDKAIDITGGEVLFFLRKVGETEDVNIGHELCTIVDGPGGIARYAPVAGDFDRVGTHFGSVRLTVGTTKVSNQEALRITIRKR